MASLLVYLDLVTLTEILDVSHRDTGQLWTIGRYDLQTKLDRLDDDATLFVCTLDADKPVLVGWAEEFTFDDDGAFTSATIRLHEHDLAELLPRLGCTGDLATFARTPRILPPGDVELLRYVLALADDRVRPPPALEPIVAETPELEVLRNAVYADPQSLEARTIYADALQSLGDPRGELIALQLARTSLPTQRESVLARRLSDVMPGLLAPWIDRHTLERGFVASCTTKHVVGGIPINVAHHPIWSTVDELYTDDRTLLGNPHLRARRLGITGPELLFLARSPHALPFEMIGGWIEVGRTARQRQPGVRYTSDWGSFASSNAFPQLRVLSLHHTCPAIRQPIQRMLANPVGRSLEHLEVVFTADQRPPTELLGTLDAVKLERLTIRIGLSYRADSVILGFVRGRVLLEVHAELDNDDVQELIRFLAPLILRHTAIELNDYTAGDGVGRNARLIQELRPLAVTLVCRPSDTLAP